MLGVFRYPRVSQATEHKTKCHSCCSAKAENTSPLALATSALCAACILCLP